MLLLALAAAAAADPNVHFSQDRGWYDAPFDLELTPETDGGTITYSLDGSTPTTAYTGPIAISTTTVVRAQETATDGTTSTIETHSYFYLDQVLSSSVMDTRITGDATYAAAIQSTLTSLPTISIVVPTLTATSQEVSLEWINPDGPDDQVYVGARRIGGASISYPKNSIRLNFRSEYGTPKWHMDVYQDDYTGVEPVDEFDTLTLRGGNHDSSFYLGASGQYIRNFWMDETQLEMGHIAPHGRFSHLFLNGQYYGTYHVRERYDASNQAEYLGGDEEDYEAVNGGSAFDGTGAAWNSAVAASMSSYAETTDWINIPNFLDYMVLQYYAANAWDWAYYHNWGAAGPVEPGGTGFMFHSSDSDICLYYDYTTNILSNPGPSYVFYYLMLEADPDFLVALADAIHRNLEADGPLTADNATARYQRLSDLAYDVVVAESARWGLGWWDRDGEWVTERDRLLNTWFPYRTDELLAQMRTAGWYPLDAPVLGVQPGVIPAGTPLDVSAPTDSLADLWVTTDGEDPRLSGGEVSASAEGPSGAWSWMPAHSARVKARLQDGDTWGPLAEAFYEVDETPPIVLNEWNAVDADDLLRDDGTDASLGRLTGNGGDWLELLVLEDHLDLRGWRITMQDRLGDQGELVFTDAEVLADLRSGTLITIAEELPEDTAYDPEAGDWRFHLRAGADGSGTTISATPFEISHRDWRMILWDTDDYLRFGPAGEPVGPVRGLGSQEVGALQATPDAGVRRDSGAYGVDHNSSYGLPNTWEGGSQDLSALRSVVVVDDGPFDTADTAAPPDSPPVDSAPPPDLADTGSGKPPPGGCGCAGGGPASSLIPAVLAALALRRRRAWAALALVGCTGKADPPQPDPADSADSPVDTAPDSPEPAPLCYPDADGDGYGDPALPSEDCDPPQTSNHRDCDDADSAVHPHAAEVCNGLDDDCDGLLDDADPDIADPLPFYADADGDGYGSDTAVYTACAYSAGAALVGGDCDDADAAISPGAAELCDDIDQDCDGLAGDALGMSAECPASTCLAVLEAGGTEDGAYYLTLPSGETLPLWCDLTTDGGGWTVGFLRNTASTGSQGGFGGSDQDVEALFVSPEEASSSADAVLAWMDLNAYDWTELQLGAYQSGTEQYRSAIISREDLRIDFGQDGYLLYGGTSPYYWCGGNASYTDGGVGATNNPDGAPSDCKYHGSLGSGWDFSESNGANAGLTLCGGDGSSFLAASWAGGWTYYGTVGGAQAIWVR